MCRCAQDTSLSSASSTVFFHAPRSLPSTIQLHLYSWAMATHKFLEEHLDCLLREKFVQSQL
ncbi:hypothetical protein B0O80DRAFT_446890 [Mortierella sp. GBAus27b]|nr:hypothetical protein B0O80DRAFT_446865 [Mortierella sp. GBAus27b]KAI8356224.1 hypothetical protein B0O80DRAFT_446890 [Mortierella sp. GBAus27b]